MRRSAWPWPGSDPLGKAPSQKGQLRAVAEFEEWFKGHARILWASGGNMSTAKWLRHELVLWDAARRAKKPLRVVGTEGVRDNYKLIWPRKLIALQSKYNSGSCNQRSWGQQPPVAAKSAGKLTAFNAKHHGYTVNPSGLRIVHKCHGSHGVVAASLALIVHDKRLPAVKQKKWLG